MELLRSRDHRRMFARRNEWRMRVPRALAQLWRNTHAKAAGPIGCLSSCSASETDRTLRPRDPEGLAAVPDGHVVILVHRLGCLDPGVAGNDRFPLAFPPVGPRGHQDRLGPLLDQPCLAERGRKPCGTTTRPTRSWFRGPRPSRAKRHTSGSASPGSHHRRGLVPVLTFGSAICSGAVELLAPV
jgi:hypothetical protein